MVNKKFCNNYDCIISLYFIMVLYDNVNIILLKNKKEVLVKINLSAMSVTTCCFILNQRMKKRNEIKSLCWLWRADSINLQKHKKPTIRISEMGHKDQWTKIKGKSIFYLHSKSSGIFLTHFSLYDFSPNTL